MTTAAVEDYIKVIYRLQGEGRPATTSALAEALHVSPASATGMVKKLAARKLLRHAPYRGVELTTAGRKIALEVIRHHRLIELFLHQSLDLPWDRVHEEAEKIEHVLSDELEDRIAEKLGNPVADPHGDPIPSKRGAVEARSLHCLTEFGPAAAVIVRRVTAQDPEQLRYLGRLGLVPGARVFIAEHLPFGGGVRIRVGAGEHVLDKQLAKQIWAARMPGRVKVNSKAHDPQDA